MLFCGGSFCAGQYSLDYTSTQINNINKVEIHNGIFNRLYITKNVNTPYDNIIQEDWDYDTILDANFDGNLIAGNVNFTLEQIDSVIIKRRKKGTEKWLAIYKKSVETEDDFNFSFLDRLARSNTTYEYALIPSLNNIEGNVNISEVYSEFEGLFIVEKDISFSSFINITISTQKNRPTATINPLNSKYPFVITNGINNYYSGNTSAVFIESQDECYNWDYYNSIEYRENLMEFLHNGHTKLLKHFDGRIFLICITDATTQDESISNYFPTTTFNWIEIGNPEDNKTLYDNNLIDYKEGSVDNSGITVDITFGLDFDTGDLVVDNNDDCINAEFNIDSNGNLIVST